MFLLLLQYSLSDGRGNCDGITCSEDGYGDTNQQPEIVLPDFPRIVEDRVRRDRPRVDRHRLISDRLHSHAGRRSVRIDARRWTAEWARAGDVAERMLRRRRRRHAADA